MMDNNEASVSKWRSKCNVNKFCVVGFLLLLLVFCFVFNLLAVVIISLMNFKELINLSCTLILECFK